MTALRLQDEPEVDSNTRTPAFPNFRDIAVRAETLDERLACAPNSDRAAPHDADAIATWAQCVTRGDATSFAKRLEWDGLTCAGARAAIGCPAGIEPEWLPTLRTVCHQIALGMPEATAEASATPVAFEHLLMPFVIVARGRVRRVAAFRYSLLEPDAHRALEHALVERLARICTRALYAEYSAFCSTRRGTADAYEAFIAHMYADGLFAFFNDYAVAARLCAVATDLWVAATIEFISRVSADADAIAATFNDGAHPGPITQLRANLSDPHCGGRGVLIAEWSSGLTVVYKPRTLGVDAAFGDLLRWANARLDDVQIRPLRVLARDEYGWIEFAKHDECANAASVERYYTRCGALLCVVYALNGGDFHHENLLAAGEHPMLLDLEMLLGHRFLLAEQLPAAGMAEIRSRRAHVESVLNLRMLPAPKPVVFGFVAESGALSDEDRASHRAMLHGRPVSPSEHVDAIVAGFTEMFRVLSTGANELLAPGGLLDVLRGESVRFILRNTSLYLSLIDRVTRPEFLRSGIAFGTQLDVLTKTFLSMEERPAIWAVVDVERRSLAQLDVPLFAAPIDCRDLPLPNGTVRNCFAESAFEMMTRRLHGMDESDLAEQVDFIRTSFQASSRRGLRVEGREHTHSTEDAHGELTRAAAIDAARNIARDIRARTAVFDDGAMSWIANAYLPAARRHELRPMAYDVFDGYGGLAWFFAALHRASGEEEFRRMALDSLAPVRTRLGELERIMRMRRASEVGIGFGPASIACALAHVARLLDEPALLSDARRIVGLVVPKLVAAEDTYDVLSGSGGAVLALLTLSEQLDDPTLIERADEFGAHLLRRASIDGETRHRVWRAPSGAADIGFAHGQAGIAYALQRLARATGTQAYDDAACEAIAYERTGVASDPASAITDERTAAWAHGSTGIALARLGAFDVHSDASSRREIDAAIQRALEQPSCGVDSLCAGTAARLELLKESADRLGQPELLASARRQAAALTARATANGGYETGFGMPRRWDAGLFQGTAGIGYALLRLAVPALPSPYFIA